MAVYWGMEKMMSAEQKHEDYMAQISGVVMELLHDPTFKPEPFFSDAIRNFGVCEVREDGSCDAECPLSITHHIEAAPTDPRHFRFGDADLTDFSNMTMKVKDEKQN